MENYEDLNEKWAKVLESLEELFGKKPDTNAILFLIGVRELGSAPKKFTKEQKIELMHIAVCKLLSQSGYYRLVGKDEEGWPHWESVKKLPFVDVMQQENFLKFHIVEYFENL